jgi:hypothetical protein
MTMLFQFNLLSTQTICNFLGKIEVSFDPKRLDHEEFKFEKENINLSVADFLFFDGFPAHGAVDHLSQT